MVNEAKWVYEEWQQTRTEKLELLTKYDDYLRQNIKKLKQWVNIYSDNIIYRYRRILFRIAMLSNNMMRKRLIGRMIASIQSGYYEAKERYKTFHIIYHLFKQGISYLIYSNRRRYIQSKNLVQKEKSHVKVFSDHHNYHR